MRTKHLKQGLIISLMLGLAGGSLLLASCSSDKSKNEPEPGTDAGSDGGGDADTDGDSDTDGDTDTDGDGDAGGDAGGACDTGGGVTQCTDDTSCGGAAVMCSCPKLFADQEITSYCYPACDPAVGTCADTTQTCVQVDATAALGTCINNGYWEHSWKGKYLPVNATATTTDITMDSAPFAIGTINLTFSMSIIMEVEDPTYGTIEAIVYIAQSATGQFQLQIQVPKSLFVAGTTIQFSDCAAQSLACGGSLLEAIGTTTITQAFIRAVQLGDSAGTYENWVKIDTANLARTKTSTGSCKLFFGEYSAEISLAK